MRHNYGASGYIDKQNVAALPPEARITFLENALVECFDAAIPQAAPWTGTPSEKAEYAARTLPEHLRGLERLYRRRYLTEVHKDLGPMAT
jgi:hypothetical protein